MKQYVSVAQRALEFALDSIQTIKFSVRSAKLTGESMKAAKPATPEITARDSAAFEVISLAQSLRSQVDARTLQRFPQIFGSETVKELSELRNVLAHEYGSTKPKTKLEWDGDFAEMI
ncbi:MAG: hypothetical protein M1835_006784 [Candelina submexicana]|nr:MAG: hypothetical protein M1835_006784 [Candelina submexicana]